MRYETLIVAGKILEQARLEVLDIEGPSPAYHMLRHAHGYVMAEANAELRGE